MSKHTPGPWGTYLNSMEDVVVRKMHESGHEQECIARYVSHRNARLIAAAPDLYEALKLADAALSGANMNMDAVQRKVLAAIAKAEGV